MDPLAFWALETRPVYWFPAIVVVKAQPILPNAVVVVLILFKRRLVYRHDCLIPKETSSTTSVVFHHSCSRRRGRRGLGSWPEQHTIVSHIALSIEKLQRTIIERAQQGSLFRQRGKWPMLTL
jgi:hypothetical protein